MSNKEKNTRAFFLSSFVLLAFFPPVAYFYSNSFTRSGKNAKVFTNVTIYYFYMCAIVFFSVFLFCSSNFCCCHMTQTTEKEYSNDLLQYHDVFSLHDLLSACIVRAIHSIFAWNSIQLMEIPWNEIITCANPTRIRRNKKITSLCVCVCVLLSSRLLSSCAFSVVEQYALHHFDLILLSIDGMNTFYECHRQFGFRFDEHPKLWRNSNQNSKPFDHLRNWKNCIRNEVNKNPNLNSHCFFSSSCTQQMCIDMVLFSRLPALKSRA